LWLKQLPIFREADVQTLELFAAAMIDRQLAAGEILCRQGEFSTDVFVIARGDTEIQVDHEGRRVATDRVEAGSSVGEMAVLTNQPRSATVVAGPVGTSVVVIPGSRFRNLLLIQPVVGINMLATLGQRLRQNEMRKHNAELAERVDDLARGMAATEATMRAKSDFLAAISHELRTPLNGMIGLTEMVLDTPLTKTQRDYLSLVRESGDTLLTLINDLLDLSKIEAGQMNLEELPFTLRDRLGDALKTLAVRAHRKGLELGLRVRPEVPDSLIGDNLRLRQVIVNLVGNAIKFTEHGEVRIDIQVVEQSPEAVTLQFSVLDTGIGIPKERLATIFQPYAQADATIARRFGGTGLGLSISVKLIERMAGRIWVDSTLGQGSTFHFTAKFRPGPSLDTRVETDLRNRLSGQRALVVESHASTRQSTVEMLRSFGLSVEDSADGVAERSAAARRAAGSVPPYELVVVEGRLPDSLAIAEDFRLRRVPLVVILTTSDQPTFGARCDELGIPHLLKPVKPSELREIIAAHAENLSATGPSVSAGESPSRTAPEASATTAPAHRFQVLLAEDNLVNQKLAKAILEKLGHAVVVASNGREALGAIAAHRFDVVLMDVLMPQLDGLETTAAIREREALTGGHLPIIAMTAHSLEEEGQRCLAAGMDAFLSKPVRPQKLAEVIESVVVRSAAADPAREPGSTAPPPIDWSSALTNVGGNRDLLAQIVALVQAELPRLLAETLLAVRNRQGAQLRMAARTLKGLFRTLGPRHAMELVDRLEALGTTGDLTPAPALFIELEEASRQLLALLSQTNVAAEDSYSNGLTSRASP